MKRKSLFNKFTLPFLLINIHAAAQQVGIGTANPQKMLTVNGSILLDQGNNNFGTLDSAALLFGSSGGVGIAGNKNLAGSINSLSFFTGNNMAMNISATGNVGIGALNAGSSRLHVAGSSNITGNQAVGGDFNLTGHGLVSGNFRVNGIIGVNGPANASYGLMVNNSNSYFQGSLSATGNANIGGTIQAGASVNVGNNLNVANDGIIDNNFRVNGRVGINGPTNGSYGLMVNNSNSYFQGNLTTTGTANIGGTIQAGANVNVANNLGVANDGIIENNFRVNGRVGINGPTNGSYGLMVNNSNSYFQGNVTATGTVNASGNLTIKGNGHVRSNGSSNLRIGFTSKNVDTHIINGASLYVTANIASFSGDNNDARVFVAQVVNDSGIIPWAEVNITVMGVNGADGTCLLWLHNVSGFNGLLKGTIYLTTISKD